MNILHGEGGLFYTERVHSLQLELGLLYAEKCTHFTRRRGPILYGQGHTFYTEKRAYFTREKGAHFTRRRVHILHGEGGLLYTEKGAYLT